MKHFFIFSLLLFIVTSSEVVSSDNSLNYNQLFERDGVFYSKIDNTPFSGSASFIVNGTLITKDKLKDGIVFYRESFCKNGLRKAELHFIEKNVFKDGNYKKKHCNGNIDREFSIKDGQYDGLAKIYFENGLLNVQTFYSKGLRNGTEHLFYENGNIKSTSIYINDKLNGTQTNYHPIDGSIWNRKQFRDGVLNGSADYFELNGTLLAHTVFENGSIITPTINQKYLLNHFPLCSIRSSVGQRCKALSDKERENYSIKDLVQSSEPTSNEGNIIVINNEDWYYGFKLSNDIDNGLILSFTDDANKGTYYTSVTFGLKFSNQLKNWVLVDKTINYLDGSKEDKKIEGKVTKFDPPIPFIECAEFNQNGLCLE